MSGKGGSDGNSGGGGGKWSGGDGERAVDVMTTMAQ